MWSFDIFKFGSFLALQICAMWEPSCAICDRRWALTELCECAMKVKLDTSNQPAVEWLADCRIRNSRVYHYKYRLFHVIPARRWTQDFENTLSIRVHEAEGVTTSQQAFGRQWCQRYSTSDLQHDIDVMRDVCEWKLNQNYYRTVFLLCIFSSDSVML